MFGLSAGSVNNQILLPIYNALSQCNGVRVPSGKSFQTKAKHTSVTKFNNNHKLESSLRNDSNEHKIKENSQYVKFCKNEMKNILTPQLLRTVALHGPPMQSVQFLNQVRNYTHMTSSKSHWMEHHSSYNTFTENKNGYQFNHSAIVNQILSNSRNHKKLLSFILFDLRANFHTRRTTDQVAPKQLSISNKLKIDTSEKFTALLTNETSEQERKNLKIAFAEGYVAANESYKIKSKFYKSFKNFAIFFLFSVAFIIFFRSLGSMGSMFKIRMSSFNEVLPEDVTETFNDVRGVEEAKEELQEIVEFLRNPSKFTSLGAELPKGVLLVGPPGTGKTLLARAIAGEAGVPFFHAAGSEFDEVLVGQGAKRVRDLFQAAKSRAPCVIFIDEIDSVGSTRSSSSLHPYANQTINQLLGEMDGFHKTEGVIVLGATNRRDDLDKALLRPGRFDVEVRVAAPDLAGRKEIFDYYLNKIKVSPEVDLDILARGTSGFTGADIKNVVNQSALRAAADQFSCVSLKHLEYARDKILMGPERKTRIPDEEENWITAYHESGHTIVSYFTKDSDPLHKVTIMPRGSSLGHTAYIPAKERYHTSKSHFLAMMDICMGGRAAEEIIYGQEQITGGASSDLQKASQIASFMVKDLGMSDIVGLRTFETDNTYKNSGNSLGQSTKEDIDDEIKRLLQESYDRAMKILNDHCKEHKALAEALMKYETLDAQDIKTIIDGKIFTKKI